MKAKDIVRAGHNYKDVEVESVGTVKLRGLTVAEAIEFTKKSEQSDDRILMFAYLVKLCCPAFRGFWWTPERIRKKLALNVLLNLGSEIMALSGFGKDAVTESVKD